MLAIETSQRVGGVALRDRHGEVHVEMLASQSRHDDDLMPAIDRLFRRAVLSPADLNSTAAIAVSIGPGGFTGLRIAVTTAKILSETTGAKVVAVPSALVAAHSCNVQDATSMLVALACKGETCWCTALKRAETTWAVTGAPGIRDAESLDLHGVQVMIGDEYLPEAIRQRCLDEGVRIIPPAFSPQACLLVGEQMLTRGETLDPLHMLPLYPREPEAVTLWNAKLKRGGA